MYKLRWFTRLQIKRRPQHLMPRNDITQRTRQGGRIKLTAQTDAAANSKGMVSGGKPIGKKHAFLFVRLNGSLRSNGMRRFIKRMIHEGLCTD